jgi:hypothetical protein
MTESKPLKIQSQSESEITSAGKKLDRMARMTGDLAQQFMFFEKRDRNQLGEQTRPRDLRGVP